MCRCRSPTCTFQGMAGTIWTFTQRKARIRAKALQCSRQTSLRTWNNSHRADSELRAGTLAFFLGISNTLIILVCQHPPTIRQTFQVKSCDLLCFVCVFISLDSSDSQFLCWVRCHLEHRNSNAAWKPWNVRRSKIDTKWGFIALRRGNHLDSPDHDILCVLARVVFCLFCSSQKFQMDSKPWHLLLEADGINSLSLSSKLNQKKIVSFENCQLYSVVLKVTLTVPRFFGFFCYFIFALAIRFILFVSEEHKANATEGK